MATVYSKRENIKLPKITEATLLTSDELASCGEFVKDPPENQTGYWYLRTPYEDNLIGMAAGSWEAEPTEPDYEDVPPYGPAGTGLRPVLHLESSELSDGTKLVPGDLVEIAGEMFTVISETMLLSDFLIDFDEDENSFGIFDPETNDYEASEAKMRVDRWFKALRVNMLKEQ